MPQKPEPPAGGPAGPDEVTDAKPDGPILLHTLAAKDAPAGTEPRADGKIPVRLSHRPDADTHVHPSELPQLRSQGLLIEDPAPSGASAKAAKPAGKDR